MAAERRSWSLESARAVFSDVRARTEKAYLAVEELLAQRDVASDDAAKAALDDQVRGMVSLWAREMEALGLDVKGPWLVDFDCGGGLLCWRWPEEQLEFFHGYDEGFEGRIRIQ